jgi:hypothetical protein
MSQTPEFGGHFEGGFPSGRNRLVSEYLIENATKRKVRGRQAHFSRRLSLFSLRIDRSSDSGSQIVAMMQTTKPRHCYDLAPNAEVRCGSPTGRCSFRQRKVGPVIMVIADVLKHKPFQVAFIEHDHMVEQITTTASDPALGDSDLPWTSEAG